MGQELHKAMSISHSKQWYRRPALSEVTAKRSSSKEAEESCLSLRAPHPHPPPATVIHAADCVLIHLNSLAREACRDRQHKPWIIREEDYPPGAEDSRIPISASKAAQASRNSSVHWDLPQTHQKYLFIHFIKNTLCHLVPIPLNHHSHSRVWGTHTGQTLSSQPSQFGKIHRTISEACLAMIQSKKTRWVRTWWA